MRFDRVLVGIIEIIKEFYKKIEEEEYFMHVLQCDEERINAFKTCRFQLQLLISIQLIQSVKVAVIQLMHKMFK